MPRATSEIVKISKSTPNVYMLFQWKVTLSPIVYKKIMRKGDGIISKKLFLSSEQVWSVLVEHVGPSFNRYDFGSLT